MFLTDEPVIVQLLANVRVPRMMLRPTRANILLRDEETCQYCGKHMRDLTLDHVLPRSRGGQSTWENLVACCRACNGRKGNRMPKEVGMHLIRQPHALDHEYATFFLLRYPRLREAYEIVPQFCPGVFTYDRLERLIGVHQPYIDCPSPTVERGQRLVCLTLREPEFLLLPIWLSSHHGIT